jgi:glycolate oxidase FAD binding subunit
MDAPTCTIDGFGPLPVVRPDTLTALGELVREAGARGTALYPIGGQTMLDLGVPPQREGVAVDLCGLDRVIDFPARDMTVTVQAGITVAGLNEIIGRERLCLPLDIPLAAKATLGGSLAANASGSRRHGYGTARDYVIGINAINDAGEEFKAGGRVVKNVAGYDLCKLLVGSLGTLGIITQVTLKLRPLPEQQALVSVACQDSSLEALLDRLHASRTRPVTLDLLNRPAAQEMFAQANLPVSEAPWTVLIGFDGNAAAVEWQVQQLRDEMCEAGGEKLALGLSSPALRASSLAADWDLWPKAFLTLKANVLPSAVAGFCRNVTNLGQPCYLRAHAGNGIVIGHLTEALAKEQAAGWVHVWRRLASAARGHLIVRRCPSSWKDASLVWGPAPPAAWLMHAVKQQFDPRSLFNPGRFVDGL